MLNKLKLYIARCRLALALRNEEKARNRMNIERRRMAELEDEVARCELAVFTDVFYEEAGW